MHIPGREREREKERERERERERHESKAYPRKGKYPVINKESIQIQKDNLIRMKKYTRIRFQKRYKYLNKGYKQIYPQRKYPDTGVKKNPRYGSEKISKSRC